MKKDKLIEMLSKIEGNPDILLWNGYVGDYQDISTKVTETSLVKMTFESYLKLVEYEERRERNDFTYALTEEQKTNTKKCYNENTEWEFNQWVKQEHIEKKMYKEKTVYLMQPKLRGKNDMHRASSLEY